MIVGITGIDGHIGNYLSRYLLDLGYEVLGLARSPEPAFEPRDLRTRIIVGDLRSPDTCLKFASQVDVIIHLAHSGTPMQKKACSCDETDGNIASSLNLMEAIRVSGRSTRLIYSSSGGAVYGRSIDKTPFHEDDICRPECTYGIQKHAIENHVIDYTRKGVFDSCILRISNTYGSIAPSGREQGLIGVALYRFKEGRPIQIYGDPRNMRDYIHLEDVCELIHMCMQQDSNGSIYNVGSGIGTSVDQVLILMESFLGTKFERDQIVNDRTKSILEWSVLNIEKVRTEMGWSPRVDLDVGVSKLCQLYCKSQRLQ